MKTYRKKDFPVSQVRRILEPGPVVLVTSHWKGETDVMTMGWHMVMEFSPSLVGCIIASSNHSFGLISKSRECVINVPSVELKNQLVGIGNCSGEETDKFKKFKLTAASASKVKAPLIRECFANFECRLADAKLLKTYNFFIFEVVKAHVTTTPNYPKTLHYHGKGIFSEQGRMIDMGSKFTALINSPYY